MHSIAQVPVYPNGKALMDSYCFACGFNVHLLRLKALIPTLTLLHNIFTYCLDSVYLSQCASKANMVHM